MVLLTVSWKSLSENFTLSQIYTILSEFIFRSFQNVLFIQDHTRNYKCALTMCACSPRSGSRYCGAKHLAQRLHVVILKIFSPLGVTTFFINMLSQINASKEKDVHCVLSLNVTEFLQHWYNILTYWASSEFIFTIVFSWFSQGLHCRSFNNY